MIKYKAGEMIFNQNDAGDCAFIIESGRIQIFIHKNEEQIPLSILGQGEIFGEMSLLDNLNRSASAKAIEDCTLTVVNREQLNARIHSADPVVKLLIRILLKRIRNQNDIHSGLKNSNFTTESYVLLHDEIDGVNKIKLENKIFQAFRNNEFLLFHQPIVDIKNKKIVGSESLLRWMSPTEGLISPSLFIDLVENSSIIIPVGEWIIEESFKQLKAFQKIDPEFSISINISGKQFVHDQFTNTLTRLQNKHQINPSSIKLEMTERILMEGVIILDTLNRCRELGYKISLDDFGTGFSSLQYLSKMPIDYLKIDGSFVQKMQSDFKTVAIIKSIIYLAKALDIQIISEGIETEQQRLQLTEMGSDFGQGYLFSKALPAMQLIELLTNNR